MSSAEAAIPPNSSINDLINNNDKAVENEGCSEFQHSKFCFSKDISSKEESLLKQSVVSGSSNAKTIQNQTSKKSVTFDPSSPALILVIDTDQEVADSASDESLGRKCFGFDTDSETFLSPSESDVFDKSSLQDTISTQSEVISNAEDKLKYVLAQLQSLWLDIQVDGQTSIKEVKHGNDKSLTQLVGLTVWITDQLSSQYRKCVNPVSDPNHLGAVQTRNEVLEEELNNAKSKIKCLEAEMACTLLNKEVQEIAFKMEGKGWDWKFPHFEPNGKGTEAEFFFKNTQRRFDSSESKACAVADGAQDSLSVFPRKTTEVDGVDGGMLVRKRENEIDSLIRDFNEKFRTNDSSLNAQFQIYDEQVENWRRTTSEEKQQMLQDLVKVIGEQKAVLNERNHYEFLLRLLIQEKSNDDFNVEGLLENLIAKLQEPCSDHGSPIQMSLLEGAVQSLQQQNVLQRDDIYRLKHLLSESQLQNDVQSKELESCNKRIAELLSDLNSHDAKLRILQEDAAKKCDTIQQLCNEAVAAKNGLEKKLECKEKECAAQMETLSSLRKAGRKQQRKCQEAQKTNALLIKEIKETKGNMDHLAEIISQLKTGLKDQKSQWDARLKVSTEEASQSKQHCDWLKSQMEQMNQQLKDAHDRLKLHEMDKVQLAQQLLLAEEERRVVDRKLQELRTALQGDTGLREALIERNEALQMEINRLRHAKNGNSPVIMGAGKMGPVEPLRQMEPLQPTTELHPVAISRKNCFNPTHPRRDFPRTAVSLHNGGGK